MAVDHGLLRLDGFVLHVDGRECLLNLVLRASDAHGVEEALLRLGTHRGVLCPDDQGLLPGALNVDLCDLHAVARVGALLASMPVLVDTAAPDASGDDQHA
jgi:hypothetical protein